MAVDEFVMVGVDKATKEKIRQLARKSMKKQYEWIRDLVAREYDQQITDNESLSGKYVKINH